MSRTTPPRSHLLDWGDRDREGLIELRQDKRARDARDGNANDVHSHLHFAYGREQNEKLDVKAANHTFRKPGSQRDHKNVFGVGAATMVRDKVNAMLSRDPTTESSDANEYSSTLKRTFELQEKPVNPWHLPRTHGNSSGFITSTAHVQGFAPFPRGISDRPIPTRRTVSSSNRLKTDERSAAKQEN